MKASKKIQIASFNCPNCGAAAAPDSVWCPYCRSSIATRVCPSCFGAVAVGMEHCPSCGAWARSSAPDRETPLKCPRCETELSLVPAGGHKLHECTECGGLWVGKDIFQEICTRQEDQEAVLAFETDRGPGIAPPGPSKQRVYVACPACGRLMNRKNFAGCSGVVLDWCREHGSWFDRKELQQIVTFIRNGGLRKSRERELMKLQEEKSQLRQRQYTLSSLGVGVGGELGGSIDSLEVQDPLLRVLSVLFGDLCK